MVCFLDDEFHNRGRDWYTGETWSVFQNELIAYSEKLKMDGLKKKRLGPFLPEKE